MNDEPVGGDAPKDAASPVSTRPIWVAFVGLAAAVIGAVVAGSAAGRSQVGLMVVGAVVGGVGLGCLSWWLRAWTGQHRKMAALTGFGAATVGVVLVLRSLDNDDQALAITGVAVSVLGSLLLAAAFRLARLPRPDAPWIAAGFVAAAIGLAVASSRNLWIGLAIFLAGLIVYKLGLLSLRSVAPWHRYVSVGVVAAGSVMLVVGTSVASAPVVGSGGFLLGMGLLAATATLAPDPGPAPEMTRTVSFWSLLLAVSAIVVGTVQSFITETINTTVTVVIIGTLLAVGVSFVVRGDSLLFLLIAGVAVIWVSLDRVEERSPDRHPEAEGRILALGDSYISGEGAPMFFEGTNEKGTGGNQCRRSPTAYPVLVADELEMGLDFLACSGAKTVSLEESGVRDTTEPNDLVAQLEQAATLDKDSIRVVLVSIGGNDARFGDIGKACLVPASCKELRQLWLENVGQIGVRIRTAYRNIRAAFPNAAVIVMPYPLLIEASNCSWSPLTDDEHQFIREFIATLDDQIKASAMSAGVRVLEDALFAFDERQICDGDSPDDSAMNVVNVNPVNGSVANRLNPTNWFHGSLHPKPSGHQLIADALTGYIREVLAEVETSGNPNPEPDPAAVFTLRGMAGATRALMAPDDVPTGAECAPPGPFAERAQVVDERAFIPLVADPGAPVCFTDPTGAWVQRTPEPAREYGPREDVVRSSGGTVSIRLTEPTNGEQRRWVLYTPAAGVDEPGDGAGEDRTDSGPDPRNSPSNLMLVDFCALDPTCDVANVTTWRNERLAESLQHAVIPSVLLVLGGWGVALWLRRSYWR